MRWLAFASFFYLKDASSDGFCSFSAASSCLEGLAKGIALSASTASSSIARISQEEEEKKKGEKGKITGWRFFSLDLIVYLCLFIAYWRYDISVLL